jgi:hypothetical protein
MNQPISFNNELFHADMGMSSIATLHLFHTLQYMPWDWNMSNVSHIYGTHHQNYGLPLGFLKWTDWRDLHTLCIFWCEPSLSREQWRPRWMYLEPWLLGFPLSSVSSCSQCVSKISNLGSDTICWATKYHKEIYSVNKKSRQAQQLHMRHRF